MQNMGAGRPLSLFEDPAGNSMQATTWDTTSLLSIEPNMEDKDADEHLQEEEMHECISEFLAEAL